MLGVAAIIDSGFMTFDDVAWFAVYAIQHDGFCTWNNIETCLIEKIK